MSSVATFGKVGRRGKTVANFSGSRAVSVDYGNLSSHVRTGGAGGGGEDFIDNLQPKGQYWLVSSCERLVRVSVSDNTEY